MKIPILDILTPGQRKIIAFVGIGSILLTGLFGGFVAIAKKKPAAAKEKKTTHSTLVTAPKKTSDSKLLPLDIDAHQLIGRQYLKADRPDKAIPHLLRIVPYTTNDNSILVDLATAYLSSFEYKKALAAFTELTEIKTSDSLAAIIDARLGLTLLLCQRVDEAHEQLLACIKKNPTNSEAFCYLGQAQASTSEPPEIVLKSFDKAIALASDNVEARYQQARYLMEKGKYLEARDSLMKILTIDPLNIRTHSRLGMIYYYLKQPEFALKSYQTALALNSDDYNTHYNLGELFFTYYQDTIKASIQFKKTIELKPDHPEANFKLGVICLGNEMNREAAGYLEKACMAKKGTIRYLLQLGVAYEKLGADDKALNTFNEILEIDALNPIAGQKIKLLSQKSE